MLRAARLRPVGTRCKTKRRRLFSSLQIGRPLLSDEISGQGYRQLKYEGTDFDHCNRISTLQPGKCHVWMQVFPPPVHMPWQSLARIPFTMPYDKEKDRIHLAVFWVRGLETGWHRVRIEYDLDVDKTGHLNVWRIPSREPVKGMLLTPAGYRVTGERGWAGLLGSPGGQGFAGLHSLHDTQIRTPALCAVLENDAKRPLRLARPLPNTMPEPTTDEWDPVLLGHYLRRLPHSLRNEIEAFDSPVIRAALCLRAYQMLLMVPFVDRPTLNVVTTLSPGQTKVRVYNALDTIRWEDCLPITAILPDGSVTECRFLHAHSPKLADHVVDIEYARLPTSRFGKQYRLSPTGEYGICLSDGRSILLRSAIKRTGGARLGWLIHKHESTLLGFDWPGILRIIEADRAQPRDKEVQRLSVASTLPGEGPESPIVANTEFASQIFSPRRPEDFFPRFPDRLPGSSVTAEEAPTIAALMAGEIPDTGLSKAMHERLRSYRPDRLSRACEYILDYFQAHRRRELNHLFGKPTGPRSRCLPQTLNFLETPEDAQHVMAFVLLDRVFADFAFALPGETQLSHFYMEWCLPAADQAAPYGVCTNARLHIISRGTLKSGVRRWHLGIDRADGTPLGRPHTLQGLNSDSVQAFARRVDELTE